MTSGHSYKRKPMKITMLLFINTVINSFPANKVTERKYIAELTHVRSHNSNERVLWEEYLKGTDQVKLKPLNLVGIVTRALELTGKRLII